MSFCLSKIITIHNLRGIIYFSPKFIVPLALVRVTYSWICKVMFVFVICYFNLYKNYFLLIVRNSTWSPSELIKSRSHMKYLVERKANRISHIIVLLHFSMWWKWPLFSERSNIYCVCFRRWRCIMFGLILC